MNCLSFTKQTVVALVILHLSSGNCLMADQILMDTPEKLVEPDRFIQSVPKLSQQRQWKDYATKEEIALFEGPEHLWPKVPKSAYNLDGFDPASLGDPVPPVGVHPRVLISPRDMEKRLELMQETVSGQRKIWYTQYVLDRTLFDPKCDDGKQYAKLVSGDLDGLEWDECEYTTAEHPFRAKYLFKGYNPCSSYSVHANYFARLFNAAAMICLINGNETLGKEVATATANYWKLREEIIDSYNENVEQFKYGGKDEWRNMHQVVGNLDLGWNYELMAGWMTEDQKAVMRRCISKATRGKRSYGAKGPARWFDTNWDGWDLTHVILAMCIEGEDGYDPELIENAKPLVEGYLTWGISPKGTIFETNGKNGAGLTFILQTMQAMARRGHNLFGHPHLRNLAASQAQCVVPQGKLNISNGTWGCQVFNNAAEMLLFYPDDCALAWLTRQQLEQNGKQMTAEEYAKKIMSGELDYRWGVTAVNLLTAPYMPISIDEKIGEQPNPDRLPQWNRDALNLPLAFSDETHGLFTARSSNDEDALFLHMEARPDLNHGGHQSHSAGGFHLAALGKMWAVQGLPEVLPSTFNSVPRIDGYGFGNRLYNGAPKVEYIGAVDNGLLSMASANVKNAWDYEWASAPHWTWGFKTIKEEDLSVETDPEVVKFFKGTQNYKKRIWGGSYYECNWSPTMRVKQRPVQYAYRSSGIVRGNHPYAVVIDDLKMDDQTRNYEWIMQLPMAVRALDSKGTDHIILMHESPETLRETEEITFDTLAGRCTYEDTPAKGTPLLLVQMLGKDLQHPYDQDRSADKEITIQVRQELNHNRRHMVKSTKVLSFGQNSREMETQILLIPFRYGEPIPEITFDQDSNSAVVKWKDQEDYLHFSKDGNRTRLKVERVQGDTKGVADSFN